MPSPFTAQTLAFLRALKRHNDREWFREHKGTYETYVREPMMALLAQLASDLPAFAPDLVAEPKVSLYRIYRDTRFSADKSPLKTHVAARFPSRRLPKGSGAGLYLEIAADGIWMGGGLDMPSPPELRAIRTAIARRHRALHRLVTAPGIARVAGGLGGAQLTRVPRGYAADHPAAPYLRHTQFIAGREFPAALATSPRFYGQLLSVFRAVSPLVAFLNDAIVNAAADERRSPGTGLAAP